MRKEFEIDDCTLRQWPSDRDILAQIKGFVERACNVHGAPQLVSIEFLHCRMMQEKGSRCYASRIKQHKTLKQFLETQYIWACWDKQSMVLDWGYEVFDSTHEYLSDSRYLDNILPRINDIRKGSANGPLLVSYPPHYSCHFSPNIRSKFFEPTNKSNPSPAERLHAIYHPQCARPPPQPTPKSSHSAASKNASVTATINGLPATSPSSPSARLERSPLPPKHSSLSKEIDRHFRISLPHGNVAQKRQELVNKVTKMLRNHFRVNLRVEMFGSSANSLDFCDSDLDLCIIVPQQRLESEKNKIHALSRQWGSYYNMRFLQNKLSQMGMINVEAVPTASVPICKFEDPELNIKCDINTANDMGVENSKLIKQYASFDPRIRPLLYALKHFTRRREINNAALGTLSSYTYVMMTFFYLMQCNPPVIPNLQRIRACASTCSSSQNKRKATIYRKQVVHFDVSYHSCVIPVKTRAELEETTSGWLVENTQSVGDLLVGFFKYYSQQFNFAKNAVSVCEGRIIQRRNPWRRHLIAVQDPFIKERNVAGSCSAVGFDRVLDEFDRAYTMLAQGNSFVSVCASPDSGARAFINPITVSENFAAAGANSLAPVADINLDDRDYDNYRPISDWSANELLSFVQENPEFRELFPGVFPDDIEEYVDDDYLDDMGYDYPFGGPNPASFTLVGLSAFDDNAVTVEDVMETYGIVNSIRYSDKGNGKRDYYVEMDMDENSVPDELEFYSTILQPTNTRYQNGKHVARYEPMSEFLF